VWHRRPFWRAPSGSSFYPRVNGASERASHAPASRSTICVIVPVARAHSLLPPPPPNNVPFLPLRIVKWSVNDTGKDCFSLFCSFKNVFVVSQSLCQRVFCCCLSPSALDLTRGDELLPVDWILHISIRVCRLLGSLIFLHLSKCYFLSLFYLTLTFARFGWPIFTLKDK